MPRLFAAPSVVALTALTLTGCVAWMDSRADRRELDWQSRHPPLGRLVDLDGRRVHVYEAGRPAGTAPDVVLIHGASGNLRDFTHDLVGRLAGEFRVIAVDRPGLGWSDSWGDADSDPREQARILRRALADYDLDRPVLLGHSYGGAVAMGWALEAEDELGGLVILAGATHPWEGELALSYRLQAGPLGAVSRQVVASLVSEQSAAAVMRRIFAPDPVPRGYAEHFGLGLAMQRHSRDASQRQVNALRDHLLAMAPGYPGLTLPIEVVHGTADRIVGIEIHSRRMAAEVPSAALTVLDGVGHMPHHARPDETVAAIRRAALRAGLRPAPRT